ncbi:hypothetical protein GCM10020370_14240 [Paenibacillus hodogayensis]
MYSFINLNKDGRFTDGSVKAPPPEASHLPELVLACRGTLFSITLRLPDAQDARAQIIFAAFYNVFRTGVNGVQGRREDAIRLDEIVPIGYCKYTNQIAC